MKPSLLLACAVACLTFASAVCADPVTDEANRQRQMSDMRAEAARNDQANADRSLRTQQATADAARAANAPAWSGYSPGSSGAGSVPAAGGGSVDHGPQSVVASYTMVVRTRETTPEMMARLTREAAAGDVGAQYNLGRIYYTGFNDAPRDDARARDYFRQAAAAGHAPSQANYGYLLTEGVGGPADAAEGRRWLRTAADAGNSFGQQQYGLSLVQSDAAAAARYLTLAADAGEMAAQGMMGTLYAMGEGVARDDARAVHYLQAASEQGERGSTGLLAGMYLTHRGGTMPEGYRLLRQAAEAGDPDSQRNYGLMLVQGSGYPKNEAEGFRQVERAARAGNVSAEALLANLYNEGRGVPQSDREALRWYATAASHGDVDSLATMRGLSANERALIPADAPRWDGRASPAAPRGK